MKALSFAALVTLGIAGTACSQSADATAEETEPATETAEAPASTGGSFNLGLPTETSAAGSSGSFNLALPDTAATSSDGFNLATDVSASNGLSDIPEIATDIIPADTEALPDIIANEAPADDEPVIRLE